MESEPVHTKKTMRHEIIDSLEGLNSLKPAWTSLLADSYINALPLTHPWMEAWWLNFGADKLPQIHCFYKDDVLLAIAPLMQERILYRHIPVKSLASMANGHSPFCDIIFRKNLSDESVQNIVYRIIETSKADINVLARIPDDSVLYKLFRNTERFFNHNVGYQAGLTTPLIHIDTDWNTFYQSKSRKFRKNLTNKANRFQKYDGATIERITVKSSTDPILEEMVQISKNSWKANIGNDLATNQNSRNFLYSLVEKFGPMGIIELWIARIDNKPIAYEFHATYNGITYPLRADFDDAWKNLSPGSVLEYTAIKTLFEEGKIQLYDSCANDYWYLSNWISDTRVHGNIEIFSHGLKPNLLHAVEYKLIFILRRLCGGINSAQNK